MANHSQFIAEKYNPELHGELITLWTDLHSYVKIPDNDLPMNGVIVRSGEDYIAACWLICTDWLSFGCFIENMICNPTLDKSLRDAGIKALIEAACEVGFALGYKRILAAPRGQSLRKRAQQHGFVVLEDNLPLYHRELH
jgi:hypothetical protein